VITWGRIYWATWIIVVLATFLGPEIYALMGGRMVDNTLSNWVWEHLHIQRNETMSKWTATDFLLFCEWLSVVIWLTFHFFFRRFA
jgi:hypothetical protein